MSCKQGPKSRRAIHRIRTAKRLEARALEREDRRVQKGLAYDERKVDSALKGCQDV